MDRAIGFALSVVIFISLAYLWRRIASGGLPRSQTEKIRALFLATMVSGLLMLFLVMQGETDAAIIGGLALSIIVMIGYVSAKRTKE